MTVTNYYFLVYAIFVPILGTDDFFARDYAFHVLHQHQHPLILLAKIPDPEQLEGKIRLRHLQENYRSVVVDRWYEKHKDNLPWAKANHPSAAYLHSPFNRLTDDYVKKEWPSYRRATALYLKDFLSEDLNFLALPAIIRELQVDEDAWVRKHSPLEEDEE